MGLTDIIKAAVDSVVGTTDTVDKSEDTSASLLERAADAVLGKTAESQTKHASVIAPEASTTPVTQGRRSQAPDGKDSYHKKPAQEPAPTPKS
ncbi:hypothetical protein H4582DRAFT_2077272 [Lactarius indigo]|nr:hypothetical protein H4582DRAFT_2077272 [Lactarius indigo]